MPERTRVSTSTRRRDDAHLPRLLGQRVDEVAVALLRDQHPRHREARLARVAKDEATEGVAGLGEVGVVQDDRRGLAAEFQVRGLEFRAADGRDPPALLGRP
jgi:hypothetical protein